MKLPKRIEIPKCVLKDKQYNAVTDWLSDKFGYCINSYQIEHKKGKVYAINIDWDTTN